MTATIRQPQTESIDNFEHPDEKTIRFMPTNHLLFSRLVKTEPCFVPKEQDSQVRNFQKKPAPPHVWPLLLNFSTTEQKALRETIMENLSKLTDLQSESLGTIKDILHTINLAGRTNPILQQLY